MRMTVGPHVRTPAVFGWPVLGDDTVVRFSSLRPQLHEQLALTTTIHRQSDTSCTFKPVWKLEPR
ncbi:hypothetical protein K443DRAFT_685342 [Laccaria amethystina LaAM-08-1]|uniref:Uncharacterized protein n=1 Tax=Laccaria amethystina LaAM-08-1 TaxID=1095629 RepID=A0A0C9WUP3_9AGAR|nr:hypothetical protein K443DRAFT_685342 [Laccaria amethystina LaAM-08-1]